MKKIALKLFFLFGVVSAIIIPCIAFYVHGLYATKDFFFFSIEAGAAFIASILLIHFSLRLLREIKKKEELEAQKFQHLQRPKTYKEGEEILS